MAVDIDLSQYHLTVKLLYGIMIVSYGKNNNKP